MALADPVALHDQYPFGPAGHLVGILQQLLGVCGDAEEPLVKLLLLHAAVTAPAGTVFHLFICQYGFALRAPVDKGGFFVGQLLGKHLQEDLLLPAVIFHIAGGQFTLPVIGKPHLFKLSPHVGDVFVGPFRRMAFILNGSIFRRHAKGVPPHGVQHIKPAHALETADHVTDGVIANMPHVNSARGIGKHFQQIVFGLVACFINRKGCVFLPLLLPFLLDCRRVIFLFHAGFLSVAL